MKFNYATGYHLLEFRNCPDFEEIHEIAKEFYVVQSSDAPGGYAIVPELAPNGKVNTRII